MPSIWRGSGDPITRNRKESRSAVSVGRSSRRKKPPFDVPPRIHMQRTPLSPPLPGGKPVPIFPGAAGSLIFQAHRLELAAHVVDVEPRFARRQPPALRFLVRFARLGLFE